MADNMPQYPTQRLDSTAIPPGFPSALKLWLINQADVTQSIAAGTGSALAGLSNINDIISRIDQLLTDLYATAILNDVNTNQNVQAGGGNFLIGTKEDTGDKVRVAGVLRVDDLIKIGGVQVIREQQGGWAEVTGTAKKGGIDADKSYSGGDPQGIADGLKETRQALKAVIDLMQYHGLAGT